MNGFPQTRTEPGAPPSGAALTRPQRQEFLRLLLLGRGLERVLATVRRRPGAATTGESEAVLTAIAAGAALQPGDRLEVPHGFLAAHLTSGIDCGRIVAARLGERIQPSDGSRRMRAGVGPQSPIGLAVGVAFGLQRKSAGDAAVALVDRRWAEDESCRSGLALARELALPLVVVAIDSGPPRDGGSAGVDRRDFEAVRAAVANAINGAHADRGPSLVVCAPSTPGDTRSEGHVARFRNRTDDPVTAYERWLMINGFSRAELDEMRRDATRELDTALGARVASVLGSRVAAGEGAP